MHAIEEMLVDGVAHGMVIQIAIQILVLTLNLIAIVKVLVILKQVPILKPIHILIQILIENQIIHTLIQMSIQIPLTDPQK